MKTLLLSVFTVLSVQAANAEMIDLGAHGGRQSDGYWATTLWQSDVNGGQYAPMREHYAFSYEFQITQPALLTISHVVSSVIPSVGMGRLQQSSANLQKKVGDHWVTIANAVPPFQNAGTYQAIWRLFDSRKPDGSGFFQNAQGVDTLGVYRFNVAAQAAPGEILAANSYISANWLLQPGAPLLTAPVPEPETYALMGIGLIGLIAARRRKLAGQ